LADSSKIEVDVYIGTTPDIFHVGVVRFGGGNSRVLTKKGSDLVFKITNLAGNNLMSVIKAGETLYFKATASFAYSPGDTYFDVKTGKYVQVNPIPTSNILSSTVP
jgi:hypothetical protein